MAKPKKNKTAATVKKGKTVAKAKKGKTIAKPKKGKTIAKAPKGEKGTGKIRITHAQLVRWRMYDAEARAANAEYRLAVVEYEHVVSRNPMVAQARAKVLSAKHQTDEAIGASMSYNAQLATYYKYDAHKIAIDDRTGEITFIDTAD